MTYIQYLCRQGFGNQIVIGEYTGSLLYFYYYEPKQNYSLIKEENAEVNNPRHSLMTCEKCQSIIPVCSMPKGYAKHLYSLQLDR